MSWNNLDLWDHQIDAVELSGNYLEAFKNEDCDGSALIRMPTGTGKTGVIGVVTHLLYSNDTALVIVPSSNLRDQIARKLKEEFWNIVQSDDEPVVDLPVNISTFTPSTLEETIENAGSGNEVLVCTIQTLEAIHRPIRTGEGERENYKKLKDTIGYTLFDEGHREPAPVWAQACRDLKKPLILFSATPYRNDYKLFEVEQDHIYTYRFQEALDDKYIRNIKFKESDFKSAEEFARNISEYYENSLKENVQTGTDDPRVIIRCDSKQKVIDVTEALQDIGAAAIGIHYDLPAHKKDYFHNDVPVPEDEEAIFWIHQYMLIEGLDDERFSLLGMYNSFSNARSLVQQIGRIIRNPDKDNDHEAIVFAHSTSNEKSFWEGYLKFEETADESKIGVRNLPIEFLGDQPPVRYIDQNFRYKFNPDAENVHKQFLYPRRANVFQWEVERTWDPEGLAKEVADELEQGDRYVHRAYHIDDESFFIVYTSIKNSPVLLDSYFIELDLGFVICVLEKDYIFYYDSQNYIPESIRVVGKKINPETFKYLVEEGSRTTSINLKNTDLSERAPRRQSLYAYSIQDISPGLVDHAYFPSTLRAYVPNEDDEGNRESRYIGFTSGRISEYTPKDHDYEAYRNWVKSRVEILDDADITVDSLFNRYASYVKPPVNTEAQHILLDIRDLINNEIYEHRKSGRNLEIEDLAIKVKDGKFELIANGDSYEISIHYNSADNKYILENSSLDSAYKINDDVNGPDRGLIRHINVEQALRVIPSNDDKSWIVFSNGDFYKTRRAYDSEIELSDLFTPIKELSLVDSEKGDTTVDNEDWESTSIFNLIDKKGALEKDDQGDPKVHGNTELHDNLKDLDILICDDMGCEVADFIAVDKSQSRVIFIHAKFGKGKKSASDFHDVCSQATKNLQYITPSSNEEPNKIESWDGKWKANGLEINNRIREKDKDQNGKELWDEIKNLIRSPSTRREVWIVIGNSFDLDEFKKQSDEEDPEAQLVQLYYLLQSTWAAVSATGASLRIFCPDIDD